MLIYASKLHQKKPATPLHRRLDCQHAEDLATTPASLVSAFTALIPIVFVIIFGYIAYRCEVNLMAQTTLTVRVSGTLNDFVAQNVGENGAYENVSEYIRDLIRKDRDKADEAALQRLKAELTHAFAAPESSYKPMSAADVIARNRK
ncbi:MAG: hypothetical protein WBQ60_01965 [Asticcacaulis sp.]